MKIRAAYQWTGLLVVFLSLSLISCGRLAGEFAFKRSQDEVYHRVTRALEFNSNESIKWAYILKKTKDRRDVGVVIQKKELGWIEVKSWVDYIDPEKTTLHGEIYNFPVGDYRILILDYKNNNRIVDSIDFIVYKEDEE